MKPMVLCILFVIFILSTSACSVILKKDVPQLKNPVTDWSEIEVDGYKKYKFQREDVSVLISPFYNTPGRIMWLGPPVVPIIPKFLFANPNIFWQFSFLIEIQSPFHTASIDVSKVRAQSYGGKILNVTYVFLNSKKLSELPTDLIVAKGNLLFDLTFDVSERELELFNIDLGNIIINNEAIKLPTLQFRKAAKYVYAPIDFLDHLEY